MDTLIVHFYILIVGIPGLYFLARLLKKAPKGDFLVHMYVGILLLLINMLLFSFARILLTALAVEFKAGFYNWWSLFIRAQEVTLFAWLAWYRGWGIKR